MEGRFLKRRIEKLSRTLQDAILNDYPNPERVGCPKSDSRSQVLQALASGPQPDPDEPLWDHVKHCSPCYQEFLGYRDQLTDQEQKQRTRKRLVLVGFCALVLVVAGLLITARRSRNYDTNYQTASLNLQSRPVFRGPVEDEASQTKQPPLVLPRGRLNLTVVLPVSSEPGQYQIEFFRTLNSRPILTAQGQAEMKNGTTALTVKLDLNVEPGRYFMGVRQDDWAWKYYEIVLENRRAPGTR